MCKPDKVKRPLAHSSGRSCNKGNLRGALMKLVATLFTETRRKIHVFHTVLPLLPRGVLSFEVPVAPKLIKVLFMLIFHK
jgi:hypothetical protein